MKNQIATSLRFSQRRISRHREPLLRGDLHFNALVGDLRSNPVRGRETGTNEFASSYLLSKARLNLAEKQMEEMKGKPLPSELMERLTDLLKSGDEGKQ